jgi:hypothetical protein
VADIAKTFEGMYRNLSDEIHKPFKSSVGRYMIPIPANMKPYELCLLQKGAKSGLQWNVDFYFVNLPNMFTDEE